MKRLERSVHNLVDFIYMDGDLSSEFGMNKVMVDGTIAHQQWQKKYSEDDQKEVYVEELVTTEKYELLIRGRIDGVLKDDGYIIEEIKSTDRPLGDLSVDERPQHIMQAKIYAYMYAKKHELADLKVRLTYVDRTTFDGISFEEEMTYAKLETIFEETVKEYLAFEDLTYEHDLKKVKTSKEIEFPFEDYRKYQRELMGAIYQTIKNEGVLYAIAPTGIGKTMSTLFATIKAIEEPDEKIFYLTAKNSLKGVALDSMELLNVRGLQMKSVEITSKEQICFMDEVDCDPEICPFAAGFFGRLKGATTEMFRDHQLFRHQVIEEVAMKHTICPFEFSLYLSYFADVIICDYNYLFDPWVYLKRYVDERNYALHVLVDEAHNLVHRSREMYSATLDLENLQDYRLITKQKKSIDRHFKNLLKYLDELKNQAESTFHVTKEMEETLLHDISRFLPKLEKAILEESFDDKKRAMDLFFELNYFSRISELYRDEMRFVIEKGKHTTFEMKCLDASHFVKKLNEEIFKSLIFFSATMVPMEYYKQLLTRNEGEHIYLPSPFPKEHLKVMVASYISTRYKDRRESISPIVDLIRTVLERNGKYIIFFPSYKYLEDVVDYLKFEEDTTYLIQEPMLTKEERREYIEAFKESPTKKVLGCFVLGGMFSEGIDYVGEMLDGVVIIGLGLPGFGDENNLLRDYFDEQFNEGMDYAYTYPGFNKVVQGVGRVIRTTADRGFAILVDDRYLHHKYQKLMLPEWKPLEVVNNVLEIKKAIDRFY